MNTLRQFFWKRSHLWLQLGNRFEGGVSDRKDDENGLLSLSNTTDWTNLWAHRLLGFLETLQGLGVHHLRVDLGEKRCHLQKDNTKASVLFLYVFFIQLARVSVRCIILYAFPPYLFWRLPLLKVICNWRQGRWPDFLSNYPHVIFFDTDVVILWSLVIWLVLIIKSTHVILFNYFQLFQDYCFSMLRQRVTSHSSLISSTLNLPDTL